MAYRLLRRTLEDGTVKNVVRKDNGHSYDLLTDLDVLRTLGKQESFARMRFFEEPAVRKSDGKEFINRYCIVPNYDEVDIEL